MEEKKINLRVMDLVLLVVSLAFFAGILHAFGACGPKEDGGWMTCHWAAQAVAGAAGSLLVMELIHLFVKDGKVKLGLDLAAIPAAVLAALIPGRLIRLCMMADMRCRAVMAPAVTVFSVVLLVLSVVDILLLVKKK